MEPPPFCVKASQIERFYCREAVLPVCNGAGELGGAPTSRSHLAVACGCPEHGFHHGLLAADPDSQLPRMDDSLQPSRTNGVGRARMIWLADTSEGHFDRRA